MGLVNMVTHTNTTIMPLCKGKPLYRAGDRYMGWDIQYSMLRTDFGDGFGLVEWVGTK